MHVSRVQSLALPLGALLAELSFQEESIK